MILFFFNKITSEAYFGRTTTAHDLLINFIILQGWEIQKRATFL